MFYDPELFKLEAEIKAKFGNRILNFSNIKFNINEKINFKEENNKDGLINGIYKKRNSPIIKRKKASSFHSEVNLPYVSKKDEKKLDFLKKSSAYLVH